MPEDKIRVSARIPKDLYDVCLQRYDNITNAINAGLELLRTQIEDQYQQSEDKRRQDEDVRQTGEDSNKRVHEWKARVEEKDSRIEDMREQVKALYEQLHTKDNQIEQLNENMHKQAVHIQTLIQENSKLNIKLLPENSESKKHWWEFWKL